MNIQIYPDKKDWKKLLQRPGFDTSALHTKVSLIVDDVKQNGDLAVKKYGQQFDGVSLENFLITEAEMAAALHLVSNDLKAAINISMQNIAAFHASQIHEEAPVTTMEGITCWRKNIGIEKVGLYIPGGSAPLFSTVLMLCIPAKLAGCNEIILCSPPDQNGNLHPAVLYAAQLCGINKIYKIGGVQAIAAMAYGTETILKVDKIFGPGNGYVTYAKQLVQLDGIAIDMPAGPSELCVLADQTANPAFVAADLLSQAEHGPDSQVILICLDEIFIEAVQVQLQVQLNNLSRKNIAALALQNSMSIVVKNLNDAIEMINEYAPEHLIISCADDESIANKVMNAGSVFLGKYSAESVGDYASGTNHTLPTNGFAKAYSGVSVDSFVKKITYQKLTRQGLQLISKTVVAMANAEGLTAHANAVTIRTEE
jgi:histidinol dehydrogenase